MISVINRTFLLHGKSISYVISFDDAGRLYHVHFGKKLKDREYQFHGYGMRGWSAKDIIDSQGAHGIPINDVGWSPKDTDGLSLDEARQEYPGYGRLDLRSPAYQIQYENGSRITDLRYVSYEIKEGIVYDASMPHLRSEHSNASTLILILEDISMGIEVNLIYSVSDDFDMISRSAVIINHSKQTIRLNRAFSSSIDFAARPFEIVCFPGSWSRERSLSRRPLGPGKTVLSSERGASSHQMNPFVMLCEPEATENSGEVFADSLIYSGNFAVILEVDQYGQTRMQMGINPDTFEWNLNVGEQFVTPQSIIAYSDCGFAKITDTFHRLFFRCLINPHWSNHDRPIVLNSWEAMYFDFNEQKLLKLAEKAAALGIETFVIDDGWFGKRWNDHSSLGDWYTNLEKLPHDLAGFGEKLEKLGLNFGIWMEPEMISPDSDLFRRHPDWAIQTKNHRPAITRWQYILDLSKPEVCDYVINEICRVLSSAPISYLKWDMNRHMTDLPNAETNHRYILGLYHILETVTNTFPSVLIEGCSGGGGRFDPGMLYYMPQIWTSDDSDALERLRIQYGTSFAYPLSSMSAHVTVVPNHQTGRITPLKSRGDVASFGMFGYELDLCKLSLEETKEIAFQISEWKKYRKLIRTGKYSRLRSPYCGNVCAWQVTDDSKDESLVLLAQALSVPNPGQIIIKLQDLDPNAVYLETYSQTEYGGDELMYMGYAVEFLPRDCDTKVLHLQRL